MYEAVSERLGAKSTRIIMAKLEEWKSNQADSLTETERMTLLAGDLMIIQFKVGARWSLLTTDLPRGCLGLRKADVLSSTTQQLALSS